VVFDVCDVLSEHTSLLGVITTFEHTTDAEINALKKEAKEIMNNGGILLLTLAMMDKDRPQFICMKNGMCYLHS